MFRYFWLRFGLVIFSIALFCACVFFLLFNHNDTLKKYVPGEATIYLHSKTQKYNELPNNQKNIYLDWLEKHSSLSKSGWQSILQSHQGEIGLFSINGQTFGLIKPNKNTLKTLDAQDISFVQDDKVVFFPSLRISSKKFTANAWFLKINKRINFSDVLVYVQNASSLPLPLPATNSIEPLFASVKIASDQINLRVEGLVGQKIETTNKQQLARLPKDTTIYFHNILTQNIPEKVEFIAQNFKFHLLQSILGPVEFLETQNNFTIFASKKFNSIETLEKNILLILAHTLPTEKQKLLPDKTVATQLIADPNHWQFKNTTVDNHQLSLLNEPKLKLSLSIEDLGEIIAIKNNTQVQNSYISSKIKRQLNSCSLFHHNGAIILPLNNPNGIKDIVLINKNQRKLTLCIH